MGVRTIKSTARAEAGRRTWQLRVSAILSDLSFPGSIISAVVFLYFIAHELIFQREPVVRETAIAIAALSATFAIGATSAYLAKLIKSVPPVLGTRRVFLSYPGELAGVASQVAAALRESGKRVWMDRDQRFGEDIQTAIDRAIADSDVFVVLLSDRSSQYVNWEVETALKKGIRIVPVTTGDSFKMPDDLKSFPAIRLGKDTSHGIHWIVQAV